ncbi:MAG: hypothetical protein AB7D28_08830 [Candidatus Berkiella sp.]
MPVVASVAAATAVAAGTVFVWNRLLQEPDSSLLGGRDPFPAVPNIPMILTGDYLADNPKDNIYPFPVAKPLPQSMSTPITEMETAWNANITDIPGSLLVAYNALKSANDGPLSDKTIK